MSLLPSFNLQNNFNKIKFAKQYLGIGDPKYFSEKNAEQKFAQRFTLRSINNAKELVQYQVFLRQNLR